MIGTHLLTALLFYTKCSGPGGLRRMWVWAGGTFYLRKKAASVSSLIFLQSFDAEPQNSNQAARRVPGFVLPNFSFPFLKKALFYLHIQELVGLVCFFGTIDKRSNFFLLFLLMSSYQSGYFFWQFSSTQADLAKWTYECMHSDRILLPKWNVGICYAPQVEKWPRNQDLKGDI